MRNKAGEVLLTSHLLNCSFRCDCPGLSLRFNLCLGLRDRTSWRYRYTKDGLRRWLAIAGWLSEKRRITRQQTSYDCDTILVEATYLIFVVFVTVVISVRAGSVDVLTIVDVIVRPGCVTVFAGCVTVLCTVRVVGVQ